MIDLKNLYSNRELDELRIYFEAFSDNSGPGNLIHIDEVIQTYQMLEYKTYGIILNLLKKVQMKFKSSKIDFDTFIDAISEELNYKKGSGSRPTTDDLQDVFLMFGKTLKQTMSWEDIKEVGEKIGMMYTTK